MIKNVSHLAIAVRDLESEIKKYRDVLGFDFLGIEVVKEQKVRVALFEIGNVHIELVEPLSEDSPVSSFLKKRGPGLHHVAFEVDDLAEQLNIFKKNNIRLLNPDAEKGASDTRIAFVHPGDLSGVLIELVEKKE